MMLSRETEELLDRMKAAEEALQAKSDNPEKEFDILYRRQQNPG